MEEEKKITTPKILCQGAEAKIYLEDYLGEEVIVKERFKKSYRHPEMDKRLTKSRILAEVRNIEKARKALVNVPGIRNVDLRGRKIRMEYLKDFEAVKYFIENKETLKEDVKKCLILMGEDIGRLHTNQLCHGDLTTSNIMISRKGINQENPLVFIDFGLSFITVVIEDKAVDLYVLEKAFICSHPEYETWFKFILEGYQKTAVKPEKILKRLDQVRARGRKKIVFG